VFLKFNSQAVFTHGLRLSGECADKQVVAVYPSFIVGSFLLEMQSGGKMWCRSYSVEITGISLQHVENSRWGFLLCWYGLCTYLNISILSRSEWKATYRSAERKMSNSYRRARLHSGSKSFGKFPAMFAHCLIHRWPEVALEGGLENLCKKSRANAADFGFHTIHRFITSVRTF